MNSFYKGKILIATPDISNDIFSRSVVLIIEHDAEGALGLILNKKNETINIPMSVIFSFPTDVYEGGPVDSGELFFILKNAPADTNAIKITDEYCATPDFEPVLNAVLNKTLTPNSIKVFSGYSGWGKGQLESEISRGVWKVVGNYPLDLTAPYNHNLWKDIMKSLGGNNALWANAPEDISMN